MTDFTSVSIPPPKDWQAFERHSRLLFELSLGDSHTQNNGRTGQPQHGVDIFGRRGGDGNLVGIQCKGKDADYGGAVTNAELRREVKKSEKFRPPISEFILITTAPDDANIQQSARMLEQEVQENGHNLKISVWGWGRLQQQIVRFPEAIREFHPDASPFTNVLIEQGKQINEQLRRQIEGSQRFEERLLAIVEARLPQPQIPTVDAGPIEEAFDKHIHGEINTYRDMINAGRPKTAIELLSALRDRLPGTASKRLRFRIIANIAVAHHRLGELAIAAELFLEAADLNPDEPVSIANRIAALLIQNRQNEAHAIAAEAVSRFPDNADIALQRLQALGPEETFDAVWSSLPDSVIDKAALVVFRVAILRGHCGAEWETLLQDAIRAYPENRQLRALQAEAAIDRVLSADRSALGAPADHPTTDTELREAAKEFESLWNHSTERELQPDWAAAHNGALAFGISGDLHSAAKLIDEALAKGSKVEETKRLRLSIYVRQGKPAEAIQIADTLSDTPQNQIYRAELRVKSDPPAARALLARRAEYTDGRDIIGAAQVYIDSLLNERNFAEATAEAQRLQSLLPEEPHSALSLYRIHAAQGNPDAGAFLSQAMRRVHDGTDFVIRFLVSQALGEAQRFDDVVDLLYGHVSTARDAPALREVIAAAANGDRRTILSNVLESLPDDLRDLPFYRKARLALAIRRGEVRAIEDEIRAYLCLSPRSLEIHLQLLQILARQEKDQELRVEVARAASEFDGVPEDLIFLAQFKDAYGDWREAHDLAYRTWLANQNHAAVSMRYVGVFLRPGHSAELRSAPTTVVENTATCLLSDDGARDVFIVEPDPELRPTPRHLAPTHPTALLLINKAAGDEISFSDGSKATIQWIKPKQIYALHEIMDGFQKLFPESPGLERIQISADQPGGFQPVFDRVRDHQEVIDQAFDRYSGGLVPIALLARSLGRESVETLLGLIEARRPILVCEGTPQERQAASAAIQANGKRGCILDAITLHVVRSLNLEHAIKEICGPIGIVDYTQLRVQERIEEIEQSLGTPDMSLIWSDGQIFRNEVSIDEKRTALEALGRQREWMKRELEIIPAQGNRDPSPDFRGLMRRFGSRFADDLFAAEGSDRLFVSEDMFLRALAVSEFGLRTSWLQPILMKARDGRHLSQEQYDAAIMHLIVSGFEFISIHPSLLVWTLRDAREAPLPREFILASGRLGGAKAELQSHISVALATIKITWFDRRLSDTLRQAVVGGLLENLARERPSSHFLGILRTFLEFGNAVLRDREFVEYVYAWTRWHFVDLTL